MIIDFNSLSDVNILYRQIIVKTYYKHIHKRQIVIPGSSKLGP
jgi:hypothetical protein